MEQSSTPLLLRPFKWLWYLVVGIYRLFFVVLLLVIVFGFLAARDERPLTQVKSGAALVIAPSGELVDQSSEDGFTRVLEGLSGEPPSQTLVRDVTEALETAAADKRIPAAVLRLDDLYSASLPQVEEINVALQKFRAAGKPIYAWGPSYDQAQYLLATQADKISLDPLGLVLVEGFSMYNNYFRDALDKLGVSVHVFRVGEYKSAVEPFTRNDMSAEAREDNRAWLGDLWASYAQAITAARKLPETAVDDYVSGMREGLVRNRGDAAAYARETKFVDAVEKLDEFRNAVAQKVGMDEELGSFNQMYFRDYLAVTRHEHRGRSKDFDGTVALVTVQGEIVDGLGEAGLAGGDTISGLLSDVRRDPDVSAVVLRVDSPGGSVYASEQIRREVQALHDGGKPVVVSMGALAASGGYWVSMDADQIWAHDTTITGSIGIFGMIPTFEKPLEKLGIHTDGVGTTALAGSSRMDRPLTADVTAIIQSQVEYGYRNFIEGVAAGREMKVEDVDKIARGRVWSGADALKLGLVDEIGGFEEAVAAAAKLAGLEEGRYELREFKPELGLPFQRWLGFLGTSGSAAAKLLQPPLTQVNQLLRIFSDPRGVYAYCFCGPGLISQAR
jgi:protease-4